MSHRPRIVLVHQRDYMPWVFEGAARAGFDLVLLPWKALDLDPADLPDPVVSCLFLDTEADMAGAVRALEDLHAREGFEGIMACSELAVPLVARVARSLGLVGLDEETALVVRDKSLMRERLRDAGLPVPGFVALGAPEEWQRARGLRTPLVVKPATGYSSFGVVRVDDADDLEATVHQVWKLSGGELGYGGDGHTVIVEEYLDGPEISVESLVHQGEVRVCAINYKGEMPGPYFEEVRFRSPAPLPPDVLADVERQVVAAHAAFGVTTGATHTELRLCRGTGPFVLEMGARIGGGGFLHHLVQASSGIDFAAEALRICAGRRPLCWDEPPAVVGHAAAYLVPVGAGGRIERFHGLDGLDGNPEVDRVLQLMCPGQEVRPYPAPLTAHPVLVMSRHDSDARAAAFHDELARSVWIEYQRQ
ncbi:carboxylase [Streptomyces sulfonofaciens]|uniref:Carboxylase n=1 Tax=Streptomyces sulfonofaciens TaxID=68272 RepID=A0A919GM57_9ACTN|nr:ATP-grasp domain-containing protein [Streptomyces sulfonofaciens]GHH87122.1 carboxylase [Streptomyces sulfonofaciens]